MALFFIYTCWLEYSVGISLIHSGEVGALCFSGSFDLMLERTLSLQSSGNSFRLWFACVESLFCSADSHPKSLPSVALSLLLINSLLYWKEGSACCVSHIPHSQSLLLRNTPPAPFHKWSLIVSESQRIYRRISKLDSERKRLNQTNILVRHNPHLSMAQPSLAFSSVPLAGQDWREVIRYDCTFKGEAPSPMEPSLLQRERERGRERERERVDCLTYQ